MIVIVAGVSGSGKTTIGSLLAARLGCPFTDGDWLHPRANIDKMASGAPLTEADRQPWLLALEAWLDDKAATGQPGVLACSALRRAYRDQLLGRRPGVLMAFLDADHDVVAARLASRAGHFFSTGLLDSQYAALEPPGPDERQVFVVPAAGPPDRIAAEIQRRLDRSGSHV